MTIALESFLISKEDGDARAILALVELHLAGEGIRIETQGGFAEHALARSGIEAVDGGRHGVGGE